MVADGQTRFEFILDMFNELSARLRNTRVACGDFERVLSSSVTTRNGMTGIFLDPPYDAGNCDPYATGESGVSARARNWCAINGSNPLMRIVLAGYRGEHEALRVFGWREVSWKANGGYGSQGGADGRGRIRNGPRGPLFFILWRSGLSFHTLPSAIAPCQPASADTLTT